MAKIEYATFYLEWLVYALKKILNILLYIKYCKKGLVCLHFVL